MQQYSSCTDSSRNKAVRHVRHVKQYSACINISRERADYNISNNIVRAHTAPEMRLNIISSKIVRAQTVPDLMLFVLSSNIIQAQTVRS